MVIGVVKQIINYIFKNGMMKYLSILQESPFSDMGSVSEVFGDMNVLMFRGINMLTRMYEILLNHYGEPNWWPAKTPYEVIVGAVLTQNCAWSNVEKAIVNFGDDLNPESIAGMDTDRLIDIIRPAGFFNQKAVYLKAVTAWFFEYGYDVPTVRREPLDKVRSELLTTKGVGRETADSILLYAFNFPTFVADAYTIRLCERYPVGAGNGYEAVKSFFENNLPRSAEVYNRFHALIVINAKDHCRKKPVCEGCPFSGECGGLVL